MEERQQAEKLYKKSYENKNVLDEHTNLELRKTILNLTKKAQKRLAPTERFQSDVFPTVIVRTAEHQKFSPEKAQEAFGHLEKYFILLFSSPWKKEFHKLKTYCGFFQTRIKSHLEVPELILQRVGFRDEGSNGLVLNNPVDLDLIFSVAYECVVAKVECELISEVHREMKERRATFLDAVLYRFFGKSPDFSKRRQDSNLSVDVHDGSGCRPKQQNRDSGIGSVQGSLKGQKSVIPRGLPYIDEDFDRRDGEMPHVYQEATFDEHLMASLVKMKERVVPPRGQVPKSSDEWSFVRSELESKYGKKYYDGVRPDVLCPRAEQPGVRGDDFSDEGIDIEERPPPVRLRTQAARQPRGNLPQTYTGSPYDTNYGMNIKDKSFMTRESGIGTGQYSQGTVFYPPDQSILACDVAPLTPTAPPLTSETSGYMSQAAPSVVHGECVSRTTSHGRNGLSNIERSVRRTPSTGIVKREKLIGNEHAAAVRSASLGNRSIPVLQSTNLSSIYGHWSCPTCTTMNDSLKNICQVCSKSRHKPLETDGPKIGDSMRVCSACTLENVPGAEVCSACQNNLQPTHIHTYV